jgi:hypothetical protein
MILNYHHIYADMNISVDTCHKEKPTQCKIKG